MPAPNPYLAGAFVLGSAAYKGIKGINQTRQGKNILKNTKRPVQEIPQAVTDSYNASRLNYGSNSTAQEQAALNEIDNSAAETTGAITQAATDSSGLLASLTAANKAKNNAIVQTGDAAIRTHQQDLNTMINTGNTYANEVKDAWNWNKKQPYQDAMLTASSLIKAGEENKYSAINDVATGGVALAMMGAGGAGKSGGSGNGGSTDAGTTGYDIAGTGNPAATSAMSYNPSGFNAGVATPSGNQDIGAMVQQWQSEGLSDWQIQQRLSQLGK